MQILGGPHTKWEYKTIYKGAHELPIRLWSEFLNKNGKEGWELVHVVSQKMIDNPSEFANHTFLFKRKQLPN